MLGQREQIWSSLFEQRIAQELEQKALQRIDQTVLLPINIARAELEKYLPQAIRQASSEVDGAQDHSWHDKHDERLFLKDDQKGPIYQLDILRLAGVTTIPIAINDHQTALERVREINIGVTSSLRNLTDQSRQAALDRYQPNDNHLRTMPFAKSLEFVRDYITKTQTPSLPQPIPPEQNRTR